MEEETLNLKSIPIMGSLNTLAASRLTLFLASWFGVRRQIMDDDGVVTLRYWRRKYYFIKKETI